MRYIAQSRSFNCGPTAVINVLKWLGYRVTERDDMPLLTELCGTTHRGTPSSNMRRLLKRLSSGLFSSEMYYRPSLDLVKAKLDAGKAMIIIFWWARRGFNGRNVDRVSGHYCVVVKNGQSYDAINVAEGETVTRLSPWQLEEMVTYGYPKLANYSIAWFVS